MTSYQFILQGPIKPYVRMTRRGMWVDPQAQQYLASKDALARAMKSQMQAHGWDMLPEETPLLVNITISPAKHNRDLDNEVKALLDAAQGIVFKNDCWVDAITAVRGPGDKGRIILAITADQRGKGRP